MSTDYAGQEYVNTKRGCLISILDQIGESYQYRAYKPASNEINAGCLERRTLERRIADGVYVRVTASSVSDACYGGER